MSCQLFFSQGRPRLLKRFLSFLTPPMLPLNLRTATKPIRGLMSTSLKKSPNAPVGTISRPTQVLMPLSMLSNLVRLMAWWLELLLPTPVKRSSVSQTPTMIPQSLSIPNQERQAFLVMTNSRGKLSVLKTVQPPKTGWTSMPINMAILSKLLIPAIWWTTA